MGRQKNRKMDVRRGYVGIKKGTCECGMGVMVKGEGGEREYRSGTDGCIYDCGGEKREKLRGFRFYTLKLNTQTQQAIQSPLYFTSSYNSHKFNSNDATSCRMDGESGKCLLVRLITTMKRFFPGYATTIHPSIPPFCDLTRYSLSSPSANREFCIIAYFWAFCPCMLKIFNLTKEDMTDTTEVNTK